MATYVAAIGDLHAGSTLGLCPSGAIPLDDGGVYLRSKAQAWSTGHFEEFCDRFRRLKLKRGDKRVWILNGDLVDGPDHHGTTQTISRDPAVQFWILQALSKHLTACHPDAVVVVRGTAVHVGKSGGQEEGFAKWWSGQVPVIRHPEMETYSHYHFTGSLGGVRWDAAHHGRVGMRPWTRNNAVYGLATEIFLEYATRDEQPPHLAIRSHCHLYADSGPASKVRVVALPAWQIKTEYGHQKFPDSLADIGGAVFVCDHSRYTVEPRLYYPTRDTLWRSIA